MRGLNPIPLFFNTSTTANRKAIAIGLTQGAATLAAENAFYFVEARRNTNATYDNGLPGTGVLVYYVNELIPQGEGPVILRDKNLLTTGLADAFFSVGDVVAIPGTGITLTVLAGTGGAPFNIQVDYTAPVTDYNVFITRGDTIDGDFAAYMSPDIWVDSPKNGFNLGGGPPPNDQDRKSGRRSSTGFTRASTTPDRRLRSTSTCGSGSRSRTTPSGARRTSTRSSASSTSTAQRRYGPEPIRRVDAGRRRRAACVRDGGHNQPGGHRHEPFDNSAQENLDIVASVTSSPFHPVRPTVNLTNPYDREALFYFRAEGHRKAGRSSSIRGRFC